MKKIFISQPMRGRTEEEILREREAVAGGDLIKNAIKLIYGTEEEGEVIDTFFKDFTGSGNEALKFLARSLSMLAEADIAVFVKGWEEARGCRIENECAKEYGIAVVEMSGKKE